ncbi:MAG: phosphonate metabolism transcriptional regulator PhnF [Planctomycetota bacterium]
MPTSRTVSRNTSSTPEYQRIANTLREEIRSGFAPGDVIPSEHSLASRFGVNRHTVRRGVDELVQDGLLVRQRGRGTIVLAAPIDFPITLHRRFSDVVRQSGHHATNRVLSKKIATPPTDAADALKIAPQSEVVFLEQVRTMDEMPLAISRHWLPMPQFRFVLDRFQGGSLHAFIAQETGIAIRMLHAQVRACLPAADDALNLRISPKLPSLAVYMTDSDASTDQPVEYVECVFRGDATQLSLTPGPHATVATSFDGP